MTEIEKTKQEIKMLQSKLEFLEELEKTARTPIAQGYKAVFGTYPNIGENSTDFDIQSWNIFQYAWEQARLFFEPKDTEAECPNVPENNEWKTVALLFGRKLPVILPYSYDELSPNAWYRWVVFNCDEIQRDIESGYHPTPQTPDKIEENLREAFKKVQQTEGWKETQRKIDSNYDDMVKNPPEFLKFELGQSLTDLIYDWWEDVFTKNSNDDIENCIGRLVYWIEEWLPKEQSAAGSQNVDVEFLVDGFNNCLKKIKSKLRNKK